MEGDFLLKLSPLGCMRLCLLVNAVMQEHMTTLLLWSYTSCWISEMICVFVCAHAGVVRAYDEAWQMDKANCHKYFH